MQGVLTRVRRISFSRVCIVPDVLALLGVLKGSEKTIDLFLSEFRQKVDPMLKFLTFKCNAPLCS